MLVGTQRFKEVVGNRISNCAVTEIIYFDSRMREYKAQVILFTRNEFDNIVNRICPCHDLLYVYYKNKQFSYLSALYI